jgi:DNA-binding response OmpR family regulator
MIPDPHPGARILIVEDEPEFADLLALWVGRHGWRPRVARDGAAAIVSFEAEEPDLVLLDLSLPRLSGWHVIEPRASSRSSSSPRATVSRTRSAGWARARTTT